MKIGEYMLGSMEERQKSKATSYSSLNKKEKSVWGAGVFMGVTILLFVILIYSVLNSDILVPKETLERLCDRLNPDQRFDVEFSMVDSDGNIICEPTDYQTYKNRVLFGERFRFSSYNYFDYDGGRSP